MSPVSRGRKKKPASRPKKRAVDDVQERRGFAMPYGGTQADGEDYPHLDPNDADDRKTLLLGEHPHYHAIFDDETLGASPRLHIAMDAAVVNQLWDNDPPETWEAAQRLRAAGRDRLDIIHKIAGLLLQHMFPVLKQQERFDNDAYRADLRSLS